ncbi:unnamed protein product [Meloidogyne enterolobii]|uniref:Uncharacterized protein n=2 Tax=Meloidogyne enterolobii TaxID=390850 RepID=A0ACB0YD35_MELEN|nr:unnamed protein product [Meloidogyne enterolobii]
MAAGIIDLCQPSVCLQTRTYFHAFKGSRMPSHFAFRSIPSYSFPLSSLYCKMLVELFGVALFVCGAIAGGQQMPEFGEPIFPDSQFIDLISRDIESASGPIAFGHKFMTGGAGEGDQQLHPESEFSHRQEIKSDNVLPAYCDPPNPCPVGYSSRDGCLEEFDNTADFSRSYQANQQCLCDQEHMFNCQTKSNSEQYEQDLEQVLAKNGLHKSMIAKKFHVTRAEEPRRRKRSIAPQQKQHQSYSRYNPYLEGEPLNSVSKKDGRKVMQM